MSDHNESNQNVVGLVNSAIEEAKEEILKELKSKDPLWLKIVSIILPIILTGAVTLVIFIAQENIKTKIDKDASALTAWLSLAQDIYKQQFKVYMEIYESIISVESSLNDSRIHLENRQHTRESIEKLGNLSNSNRLLITESLFSMLNEIWHYAQSSIPPIGLSDVEYDGFEDFVKSRKKIEAQMKGDLHMEKMNLLGSDQRRQ